MHPKSNWSICHLPLPPCDEADVLGLDIENVFVHLTHLGNQLQEKRVEASLSNFLS